MFNLNRLLPIPTRRSRRWGASLSGSAAGRCAGHGTVWSVGPFVARLVGRAQVSSVGRAFAAWVAALVLIPAAWAQPPQPVARVALAVGQAQRVAPDGRIEPLALGSALAEQDRIVTGKDAMLMLIFADQARVAVRPDTELVIRRYRVDPAGADTHIQLDLIRGAMRQISGDAAHLQPERYRLNTPIAVIGVRGTDFLAKVGDASVETYVHEGMIVVLPPAGGSVGGAAAADMPLATLSAGNAAQYLLVRAGGAIERRTVAPEDIEGIFGIRIARADDAARSPTAPVARADDPARATLAAATRADDPARATGVDTRALETLAASVSANPNSGQGSAQPPVVPAVPLPTHLVWGRFKDAADLPWRLAVDYAQAAAGRHATVGELGQFALWRDDPRASLDRGLSGQASFALAAADALLIPAQGAASPVQVSNPQLAIDFDRMRFQTQLSLDAAGQPTRTLAASGSLDTDGILLSVGANQRVAGAITTNGREAGYLFNLQSAAGLYQGMTLWSAK